MCMTLVTQMNIILLQIRLSLKFQCIHGVYQMFFFFSYFSPAQMCAFSELVNRTGVGYCVSHYQRLGVCGKYFQHHKTSLWKGT